MQENRYDGRNFRTTKLAYTSGSVSESRDFYYTDSWQTLEELRFRHRRPPVCLGAEVYRRSRAP